MAALTAYQALSTTGGNAITDNVLVTANTPLTVSDTVNAVLIVGDGVTISGSAGTALTLNGGALASTGGTSSGDTVSVPTLALGASEGLFTLNNGTTTISSNITGINGLTNGGSGTLVLPNANNSYTGATNLNSGTVSVGNATALGTSPAFVPNPSFETPSEGVTFAYNPAGASWTFTPSTATGGSGIAGNGSAFNNTAAPDGTQVGLIQKVATISQNVNFLAAGTYALSFATEFRNMVANPANPFQVQLDGTQIGATVTPVSNTVFNTITIPFTVATAGIHNLAFVGQGSGALDVTSFIDNISISPNILNLNGGTLQASVPGLTIASPVAFNSSVVSFAGANPVFFTGTVTLNGSSSANNIANNLLTVSNTGGVTFAGQIINGAQVGTLNLLGGGTLYLTNAFGAASTYAGQTTIVSGIISAQQANSLGASATTLVAGTGAALQLQSAAGFPLARVLILNGTGVGTNGAVENVYGANTVSAAT